MSDRSWPRRFGPFELLEPLGRGGSASVYLARLAGSEHLLVIKRLHAPLTNSSESLKRFRHEAQLAVTIDNPFIAKVYEIGAVDDVPYIAMEYVPGCTVRQAVNALRTQGKQLPLGAFVRLAQDSLQALSTLHGAVAPETGEPLQIVHRDLSPRNIMIDPQAGLRLIDLGLGKSNIQDWRTNTGVIQGSLGYMPPEQLEGGRVDARADLYALACVLYELLTTHHYIPRGPRLDMLQAMVRPHFVPPSTHRADLPQALDAIFKRSLAHSPADRFQTAEALHVALDAIPVPPQESLPQLMTQLRLLERSPHNEGLVAEETTEPSEEPTTARVERFAGDLERTLLKETQRFSAEKTHLDPPPAPPGLGPHESTRLLPTVPGALVPERRGVSLTVVTLLIIATVVITAAVQRSLLEREVPLRVDAPSPRIVQTPSARAKEAPPVTTKARRAPPPSPSEVKTRRALEPRTSRAAPVPVTKIAQRLTRSALALRTSRPKLANRIDKILGDLSLWASATDKRRARVELEKLERELKRLAL